MIYNYFRVACAGGAATVTDLPTSMLRLTSPLVATPEDRVDVDRVDVDAWIVGRLRVRPPEGSRQVAFHHFVILPAEDAVEVKALESAFARCHGPLEVAIPRLQEDLAPLPLADARRRLRDLRISPSDLGLVSEADLAGPAAGEAPSKEGQPDVEAVLAAGGRISTGEFASRSSVDEAEPALAAEPVVEAEPEPALPPPGFPEPAPAVLAPPLASSPRPAFGESPASSPRPAFGESPASPRMSWAAPAATLVLGVALGSLATSVLSPADFGDARALHRAAARIERTVTSLQGAVAQGGEGTPVTLADLERTVERLAARLDAASPTLRDPVSADRADLTAADGGASTPAAVSAPPPGAPAEPPAREAATSAREAPESPAAKPTAERPVQLVTSAAVKLRREPRVTADNVLAVLRPGVSLLATGENEEWLEVQTQGNRALTGWLSKQFVRVGPALWASAPEE